MKVVYLDQNKWIDVARAFHGRTGDPDLKSAFASIRELSRRSTVVFPLSSVHYMETAKVTDHERRKRLGTAMWKISRGHTMASYHKIVRYELESALARRFPNLVSRGFDLVSKGYAHAFDDAQYPYRIPQEYREKLPANMVEGLEKDLQTVLEKAIITGEGPGGIRMPSPKNDRFNEQFKEHLKTLPQRASWLTPEKREDLLHAMALVDIKAPLDEVLSFHGLSLQHDLLPMGRGGLASLVQDMPSRKTEVHMHRQILKNPNLKPKDNDLEDWSGLGPATAHCDVVVCEKHYANLLRRDGFRSNAQVITDVRKLPEIFR